MDGESMSFARKDREGKCVCKDASRFGGGDEGGRRKYAYGLADGHGRIRKTRIRKAAP